MDRPDNPIARFGTAAIGSEEDAAPLADAPVRFAATADKAR